ncbi:DoxX family membrane protein [Bacteroidota bacterium]
MNTKYSNVQLWVLVLLRVAIGWHMLFEGATKLLNPNWSSIGYLMDSKGIFAGIFHALAANPDVLKVVDFLNVWGLILIGIGLIAGLLTKWSTLGGIALLALYYLSHPPLVNAVYAIPSEGSYLLVNKNLIELLALAIVLVFPTGTIIGIDRLIFRTGAEKN